MVIRALSGLCMAVVVVISAIWCRSFYAEDVFGYSPDGIHLMGIALAKGRLIMCYKARMGATTSLLLSRRPYYRCDPPAMSDSLDWWDVAEAVSNSDSHVTWASQPKYFAGFAWQTTAATTIPANTFLASWAQPAQPNGWIIGFPCWAIIFLSGPMGLWAWRRAQRQGRAGSCPKCGYDLRATPRRCPECGSEQPFTPAVPRASN
jgi:hypothetical protein